MRCWLAGLVLASAGVAVGQDDDWEVFPPEAMVSPITRAWNGQSQSLISSGDVQRLRAFKTQGWELVRGDEAPGDMNYPRAVGLRRKFGQDYAYRHTIMLIRADGSIRLQITRMFANQFREDIEEGEITGAAALDYRGDVEAAMLGRGRGRLQLACAALLKECRDLGWRLMPPGANPPEFEQPAIYITKPGKRKPGYGSLRIIKLDDGRVRVDPYYSVEPDYVEEAPWPEAGTRSNYAQLAAALKTGRPGPFLASDIRRLQTFMRIAKYRLGPFKGGGGDLLGSSGSPLWSVRIVRKGQKLGIARTANFN